MDWIAHSLYGTATHMFYASAVDFGPKKERTAAVQAPEEPRSLTEVCSTHRLCTSRSVQRYRSTTQQSFPKGACQYHLTRRFTITPPLSQHTPSPSSSLSCGQHLKDLRTHVNRLLIHRTDAELQSRICHLDLWGYPDAAFSWPCHILGLSQLCLLVVA